MGRRRKRGAKADARRKKRAAFQKERWDNMTANEMEDMMGSDTGRMELYGYGGRGGKFKNEAEAKQFMRDLRGKEATAASQSAVSDMVQQYTGQALPPPPGQMPGQAGGQSPKGQTGAAAGQAGGGSPKGGGGSPKGQPAQDPYQTGAPRGSYMDRVRRNRAMQGMSGYGQYGPAQPPGGPMSPPPSSPRTRSYNPVTGLME